MASRTKSSKSSGKPVKNKTLIKLLGNRVLILPEEAAEVTPGGIVLPDSAKEKPARGEVIFVGPGTRTSDGSISPMYVKVTDIVYYARYAGEDIEFDGKKLKLMREDDILLIVE